MIQNFIQEQVDILARALQRSVAIDDVGINLVAVSKHFNDADDARVRAILARTLEEDSCRYLFSFGIETTREKIVRIAACRELGFKERSCYPIRWQERTLGYLWLVGKVTPAEDKAAVACAGELAVPMFSMQLEDEQAFSKHELVVRDLLSVDTRRASRATTILSRQGRIRADRTYRVLSAAIRKRTGNLHDELHFLRKQFREFTAAHGEATSPLFTDFSPELVIVIPAGSSLSDPDTLMSIACSGVNSNLRIGIGPETDVLHLYDSYAQASSVLQVLRAIPNLGPCSTWEGLGVYGNLALLTRNQEDTQFPLTRHRRAPGGGPHPVRDAGALPRQCGEHCQDFRRAVHPPFDAVLPAETHYRHHGYGPQFRARPVYAPSRIQAVSHHQRLSRRRRAQPGLRPVRGEAAPERIPGAACGRGGTA